MSTTRAPTPLKALRGRVELVAPDTVKGRLAALAFETQVIPAVIVEPETQKTRGHNYAVDYGAGGQIKHGEKLGVRVAVAQAFRAVYAGP